MKRIRKSWSFLRRQTELILNSLPFSLEKFFLAASFLIFISSFIVKIYEISHSVRYQPIVYSNDNDAGRGLTTAQRTKLYNDNGFMPYGNFYFRIGHIMQAFAELSTSDTVISKIDIDSKNHHLHLLSLNVICLYLLCLFLSWLITKDWVTSFLLSPLFSRVILSNETWVEFLFRVHPDYILTVAVALATYATYFMLKYSKNSKYFYLTGATWGLCAAIKLSVIYFGFPLLAAFLIFQKDRKRSLFMTLKLALVAFWSYLLIGFPQNFSFAPTLKFLSNFSRGNSYSYEHYEYWLNLFVDQAPPLLILAFLLTLVFGVKEKFNQKKSIFMFCFAFMAFLPIIFSKHSMPQDHYLMPYLGSLLVGAILFFKNFIALSLKRTHKRILLLFLMIGLSLNGNFANPLLEEQRLKQLHCSQEAGQAWHAIKKGYQANQQVFFDPYYPTPTSGFDDPKAFNKWGFTLTDVIRLQPKAIGLRKDYFQVYFAPPGRHVRKFRADNWDQYREFYEIFSTEQDHVNVLGQSWKKVIRPTSCHFILWMRQD